MNEQADPSNESTFADRAQAPQPGLIREFGAFLVENKKWWLIPLLLTLGLLAAFACFASSAAAPFIYPVF